LLIVELALQWSLVLPGRSGLCHSPCHYDVRVSGLVPVPAIVLALRDAEGSRICPIIVSEILIGPAALALLGLILQLRGGHPNLIWHGDPLLGVLGGIAVMMFFAAIIGFLTTSFIAGPL